METSTDGSEERITPSFVCFLTWTFILVARPQDYLNVMMAIRPVVVISIITLLAMFLEARRTSRPFFHLTEVRLIFALFIVMIAGIPFAVHRGVAFRFVFTAMPTLIMYFIVCILQLRSLRRFNITAGIVMISVLFAASFYMKDALANIGVRTVANQAYDPNDIAIVFITCIPLCLYILVSKQHVLMKILATAAAFLATAGIMLSGSRGGFLAFALVAVLFILGRTHGIKTFSKVIIIILLAFVFFNYFSVVEGRFQNIGDDYNITDPNGRFHIWKQNMAIIAHNPILGAGA
ncbi:MAG: O-antigen ligase family protein, partial [Syntrophorhabdus sp.]